MRIGGTSKSARPAPESALSDVLADVVALLRDLVAEVRALRSDQARSSRRSSSLTREDRVLLARLLPAIGGTFGSELFVARELFEHDSAALHVVLRGLNARRVGRLLRRGEGHPIDGYLIQRDGHELHATLWRIVKVPEFSGDGNLTVPPRLDADRR